MRHKPGEVHYLPPEEQPGGDPKERRHIIVSACLPTAETVTLAFGSSQSTEARFGAAHVLVDPFATGYRNTGLDKPTYVYLSRLFSTEFDELGNPEGLIVGEMPAISSAVFSALGIGTGTANSGQAAGSWRGRVVQFDAWLFNQLGTSYGVVVTEPKYSLQRRYQTVVPVLDEDRFEPGPGDVISESSWCDALGGMSRAILAVPELFSVWQSDRISRPTQVVLDSATMLSLDTALRVHFGI